MLYSILTYVGKLLDDFLEAGNQLELFYVENNGNFILDLRIFTIRTIFSKRIMFVNQEMGVHFHVSIIGKLQILRDLYNKLR
jgi:hypothetical protein